MVITSKDNETIKHIRKLKEKKYRDEFGEYIIEGVKLISEAILENAKIKTVVVCENCIKPEDLNQSLMYEIAKYELIYVDKKVFDTITDVQNPQGILAIVLKDNNQEDMDFKEDVIIVLDDIQDPGNLGTIIRTIDSVGLKQVVVSKRSGDIYNPKVVRSTMGAIFRVKAYESENLVSTLKLIKKHKYNIVATSLNTDKNIYNIEYKKLAIVIGNESNGVSKEVLEMADDKIKIPMLGKTESLNAAVATSVILYEYVRQKFSKTL